MVAAEGLLAWGLWVGGSVSFWPFSEGVVMMGMWELGIRVLS